jgi:phage terminase Nu1 subunit (DNA packaging protein)
VRAKPGVRRELSGDEAAPRRRPPTADPPPAVESLGDDELPAYTVSQQRKAFEQANLLEIERRQKEGQLVERESVLGTWAQLINSAKSKLLSVQTTVRQRIPHLTAEEGEVIDVVIRAALADLTEPAGYPQEGQA